MYFALVAVVAFLASGAGASPLLVRLHYFDIRGLAEPIRLTMADLGIMWEEVAHNGESWKEAKSLGTESGLFTFGQMPALEYTDGFGNNYTMVQSQAILQFLGRRHGLYDHESMSEDEIVRADVVMGGVADVKKRYGKMAYAKASELEKELQEYKGVMDTWLPYFERLAPARGLAAEDWNSESFKLPEYISGPFSIADTLLYDMLDTCVERVDPEALKPFPKLRALMQRIEQRPHIAAYLKSPRRRGYANGEAATFDTLKNVPVHLRWPGENDEL